MGVEYKHYILVEDLSYIGTLSTAIAVERVLVDWGLVAGTPTIRSLDGGKDRKLRQSTLQKVPATTSNLLVEYPFSEAESITDIMGPSEFGDVDSRYIQQVAVLIGSDFRVYDGFETAYTSITSPPKQDGDVVKPFKQCYDISHYADAYPADAETTPPTAVLEADLHDWPMPKSFCGVWRCGVILDCGKDVPAFMQKKNQLPSTKFVPDLRKAFGHKLIQIGHFY